MHVFTGGMGQSNVLGFTRNSLHFVYVFVLFLLCRILMLGLEKIFSMSFILYSIMFALIDFVSVLVTATATTTTTDTDLLLLLLLHFLF